MNRLIIGILVSLLIVTNLMGCQSFEVTKTSPTQQPTVPTNLPIENKPTMDPMQQPTESLSQQSIFSPELNSTHMVDPLNGWGTTRSSILHTVDGGLSWTVVTPKDALIIPQGNTSPTLTVYNDDIAWLANPPSSTIPDMIVYRTRNGGQSWIASTVSKDPNVEVISMQFLDQQHGSLLLSNGGVAMGREAVSIYKTKDGGTSWTSILEMNPLNERQGLPFGGSKNGISFANEHNAWITGFSHASGVWLYTTHDAGLHWKSASLEVPEKFTAYSVTTFPPTFFSKANGIFPVMFINEGQLFYRTSDNGITWKVTTPIFPAIGTSFSWSFLDVMHGFATDGNKVFITKDGAITWKTIEPDDTFKQSFSDSKSITSLDFVSEKVGWIVMVSSSKDPEFLLLKTTDGGFTWMKIEPIGRKSL
jgi:photosystem II stability/assembly factor-like uncharacterized protein